MAAHTHAETMAELARQEKVLAESTFGNLNLTVPPSFQDIEGPLSTLLKQRVNEADAALIVQAVNREADRLAGARELLTEHAHDLNDSTYRLGKRLVWGQR